MEVIYDKPLLSVSLYIVQIPISVLRRRTFLNYCSLLE